MISSVDGMFSGCIAIMASALTRDSPILFLSHVLILFSAEKLRSTPAVDTG